MIPGISDIITHISPEILTAIILILLLVIDLIFDRNKLAVHYTALAGVVITTLFLISSLNDTGSTGQAYLAVSDKFGIFFKILISLTTLFIILFSHQSREVKFTGVRKGEYYVLLYGMLLGMFLLTSAVDLILIYLALELLSLSSYILSGFTDLYKRNSEAAVKYLIYGAVSSAFMLFGISLIFGLTGSTNLFTINNVLSTTDVNIYTAGFAIVLIIAGIGYKISSVPFHFWTPDVYEGAPVTITAYLSVASKAAGFALLVRFVFITFVDHVKTDGGWVLTEVFEWRTILIILSLLTMTVGNLSALWQKNIKRMLAYSSIAHAGYLLLGIAMLTNLGLLALMIYFLAYMFMNLGAFYIIMLVGDKKGSEDISKFDGIGYSMPFAGVALTIFLVSLTGLPPTVGFVGKFYLFLALLESNEITVAVIALLNTVVSLYYYARVLKHMYIKTDGTGITPYNSSLYQKILLSVLVIPVILFGIYWQPVIDFATYCLSLFTV